MRRPRTLPLVLAAAGVLVMLGTAVLVARRIADYNAEHGRVTYLQSEVLQPEFTYSGRDVAIEDLPPSSGADHGSVRVTYGEEALVLPVTIPPLEYSEFFEGLERHSDWLRLVRFAKLTGRDFDELMAAMDAGEESDRLVLVTKTVRPGSNPDTWGRVWRKDWTFDFYEFLPEGGFHHERFAYPTSRSAEQQEARREAESERRGGIPELDTRSWQFQVAHLLMPEGSAPRIIAGDSPLVAVGWPFPIFIVAALTTIGSLFVAFAPERVRQRDPAPPTSPPGGFDPS